MSTPIVQWKFEIMEQNSKKKHNSDFLSPPYRNKISKKTRISLSFQCFKGRIKLKNTCHHLHWNYTPNRLRVCLLTLSEHTCICPADAVPYRYLDSATAMQTHTFKLFQPRPRLWVAKNAKRCKTWTGIEWNDSRPLTRRLAKVMTIFGFH